MQRAYICYFQARQQPSKLAIITYHPFFLPYIRLCTGFMIYALKFKAIFVHIFSFLSLFCIIFIIVCAVHMFMPILVCLHVCVFLPRMSEKFLMYYAFIGSCIYL